MYCLRSFIYRKMRKLLIRLVRFYTFYFPIRFGKVPLLRVLSRIGLFKGVEIIGKFGNHTRAMFHINDWVQQLVYFFGTYINEETAIQVWKHYVQDSRVIIDVGANFGFYSLLSADINPNAKIYAFEPSPYILQSLKRNIELNHYQNICIHPVGVSDKSGKFKLYVSDVNNTGMSSLVDRGDYSKYTVDVDVVSLDEFVVANSLSAIDLIKIDVEGNEFNVIKGMEEIIKIHQPVIFIELLNDTLKNFGHHVNDVFQFLSGMGYGCYEFDKHGKAIVVHEPNEFGLAVFIHTNRAAGLNIL